jgi:hypothetical protein
MPDAVATRTPPPGWVIPEGYVYDGLADCRGCGQKMAWTMTPAKRRAPLNPDGTSHFANCPEADRFRQPKGAHL